MNPVSEKKTIVILKRKLRTAQSLLRRAAQRIDPADRWHQDYNEFMTYNTKHAPRRNKA